MTEPVFNKIYGLFWYKENGEPPLKVGEYRSLKHAVISKLKCIEDNNDYNLRIMINYFKELSRREYDEAMGAENNAYYFEEMEWSKYFDLKVAMCEFILARYERDRDLRKEISWSDGHDGE